MARLADFLPVVDGLRESVPSAETALLALEDILERGQALARALDAYEAGRTPRIALPYHELGELGRALGAFVDAYMLDASYPANLFLAARAAQVGVWSLQTLRRAFADQAALAAGGEALLVRPDGRGLVPYRIRQGDTLERIALNTLGSVERSWDIIELNGLVWPFISDDLSVIPGEFTTEFDPEGFRVRPEVIGGGAHVRGTGDVLWLPPDARLGVAESTITERDVELYGRDLELRDGFPVPNVDGELAIVEGMANMAQAIRHRIGTVQGELVLHPGYGIERLLSVGIEGTYANVVFSGLGVARAIAQDPRVVGIADLRVTFVQTVNTASMTVQLIGGQGRSLPINEVVSGG